MSVPRRPGLSEAVDRRHETARNGTLVEIEELRGDAAIIVALAAGKSKEEAAEFAGVSRRTVYRRLDDPAFVRRVERERDKLASRTLGKLADAGPAFAETLLEIANNPAESASARVAAARAGLELGGRLREAGELVAELRRLQGAQGA